MLVGNRPIRMTSHQTVVMRGGPEEPPRRPWGVRLPAFSPMPRLVLNLGL
jgi:hypothetical protein